jgi:hypothetical protein
LRKYKYWERGGTGKGGRIEELEMLGNLLEKEGWIGGRRRNDREIG